MTLTRYALSTPLAASLLALGSFSTTATAQSSRFIPADSQVVVRMAAPAKWKREFKDTKVAGLFAGETLGPMFDGLRKWLTSDGVAEAGLDPAMLETMWDEYQGDITVAVRFDAEDIADAIVEDRPPVMAVTFAMAPHESFDLAPLAAQIREAIEESAGDRLREETIGDHTLLCRMEDDMQASIPQLIDGHVVMMISTDIAEQGPIMLDEADRFRAGGDHPMYVKIDAAQGVSALMDFVAWNMENDLGAPPFDAVQLLTDLGLQSVGGLEMSISADGEHAVFDQQLTTTGSDLGLLGMVLLDRPKLDLLRYVPQSSQSFSVQAFDIGALYSTIGRVWNGMSDIVPISFEEAQNAFEDATKVRLQADLIGNIGKEFLMLGDPVAQADADPDDPMAMLAGTCFALAMRDGDAFGKALETTLRSRGLHAARKSEEYQGTKVYRLRIAGAIEIEYAVTSDVMLLALGGDEGSRTLLRSILDARSDPRAGLPDALADYTDLVPAGWNGVSVTPVAPIFEQMNEVLDAVGTGDMPAEARTALRVLGGLGREMKQLGIENATQFSFATPQGYRSITRM